jgi:hypothetical protein
MRNPLLILIAFLVSFGLQAQDLNFGLRGGPSFTTLGGEEGGDGSKFKVGFHIGAYINLPLSETLQFEPGIQFATKGAKGTEAGTTTSIRNGYLDIPLLLKYQGAGNLFILAGAQPSFLMSSALIVGNGDNKVTVDGKDTRDLWKGTDFAAVVGFGFNLGSQMNIQTTYEHGFANVSEFSDTVYNRGFKLSIGKSF